MGGQNNKGVCVCLCVCVCTCVLYMHAHALTFPPDGFNLSLRSEGRLPAQSESLRVVEVSQPSYMWEGGLTRDLQAMLRVNSRLVMANSRIF